MAEPVEIEGVKFTPEKTVNLDELMSQPPINKDEEEKVNDKPADEKPVDEKPVDDQPADEKPVDDKPADEKPEDKETPNNDSEEIPLEEIVLSVGDEEVRAPELLDRYSKMKAELDEIKNDPFLGKFVDYIRNNGDPAEYLQKATVKWEEVNDVDLLRRRFNEENAELDDEVKQILFERELVAKYSLNPDGTFDDENSREAKVGKQLLKRDANKYRSTKIEEQKNFLLPQKKDESQQKQPQSQAPNPETVRQQLLSDKELEGFVKKKSLPVSDGLSYEVEDPTKVIGMMADVGQFWKLFQKPDGQWDKVALAKVFSIALNPKKYDDHLLGLGKDMGSESYLKEQKNTQEKGKQRVVNKEVDTEDVVVIDGKIVRGNKEKMLQGFIASKR